MIESAREILKNAIEEISPTHIVSMVSGGKDSAASHQVLTELGVKADLILHGNTRCGIPETTDFVRGYYGHMASDYAEADAGTAYEDYVLRKGFFGKGLDAHHFAFHVLKAGPFRKAISKHIRQRKRNIRVMLINGARKDESENRKKNLKIIRQDGDSNNFWVNPIHHWTQSDRDSYLSSRQTPINPVAKALCRSGECMCGTQQSKAERIEAASIYPHWGRWLDNLEDEVKATFNWGWGEDCPLPKKKLPDAPLLDLMCSDCKFAPLPSPPAEGK